MIPYQFLTEKSRAAILTEYVLDEMESTGDTISYEELILLLEIERPPPEHRASVCSQVVDRANRRLFILGDWRRLVNVELVGYRIADPEELCQLVMRDEQSAHRKLIRSAQTAVTVIRHPEATAAQRKRASDVAANQGKLAQVIGRSRRANARSWATEETSPVPKGAGE